MRNAYLMGSHRRRTRRPTQHKVGAKMTEFHKVTPDLGDPFQNEFVQDYLSAFQKQYDKCVAPGDNAAIDSTIEQIQEIYRGRTIRLPDIHASEVTVGWDKQGHVVSLEIHGQNLDDDFTWILVHTNRTHFRVSTIAPES